jgi:hypothetical protein
VNNDCEGDYPSNDYKVIVKDFTILSSSTCELEEEIDYRSVEMEPPKNVAYENEEFGALLIDWTGP